MQEFLTQDTRRGRAEPAIPGARCRVGCAGGAGMVPYHRVRARSGPVRAGRIPFFKSLRGRLLLYLILPMVVIFGAVIVFLLKKVLT